MAMREAARFLHPKPSLVERDRWSWGRLVARIKRQRGNRCEWCGDTERLEVDHIQARVQGGGDHPDNLRVLCHRCHRARHNGLTPADLLNGSRKPAPRPFGPMRTTGAYGSAVITGDYTWRPK